MGNIRDNCNEINDKNRSTSHSKQGNEIFDRYLPPNEVHILGGRSGVGKTHLMFQVIDRFRGKLEPILYVAADRSKKQYLRLFKKLGIEPWPLISLIDVDADELTVGEIVEKVDDYERPFLWLDGLIEDSQTKPRTVVLDPAPRFIPCRNVNLPSSAAGGFAALMSWATKHKFRVLLNWYPSKTAIRDINDIFDRLAGSHGIQGHTSTKAFLEVSRQGVWLNLRGQHFADLKVQLVRQNDGSFRLANRQDQIRLEFPIYPVLPTNPTRREDIISLIRNSDDDELSNLSESTIDRQLKKLLERGFAKKSGHGMYCREVKGISLKPSDAQ